MILLIYNNWQEALHLYSSPTICHEKGDIMKGIKTIALILAMATSLLVFTVPASAQDDESGIAPHYERCPDCGGRVVMLETIWDNIWLVVDEPNCEHYNYGTDLVLQDQGRQYWQCTPCKRGTSYPVSRDKTECHGYDPRTAATGMKEADCTHYCYGTDLIAKDGTKVCHGYDPK